MADVWVPGWEIRRFTDPKSGAANANRVACAHTIVGGLPGAWDWGNRDGKPYPHSYIEGNGHGINAQPVNLRAAANLEGNSYCWSIETEDVDPKYFPAWNLTCGNVPAWTDAQLETLTEGMAWWCLRYQRPPVLIPNTRPGVVGLAYHRQGVPNSPEWVTGNDQWTTSSGKCCPDWRRIHQFKTEVVPGVARIVNGEDDVTPEDHQKIADLVEDRLLRTASWLATGRSDGTLFNDQKAAWRNADYSYPLNRISELIEGPQLVRARTFEGEWVGPAFVVAAGGASKWEISGWDNVDVMVASFGLRVAGTESGHAKPFGVEQAVLDQIPTISAVI